LPDRNRVTPIANTIPTSTQAMNSIAAKGKDGFCERNAG